MKKLLSRETSKAGFTLVELVVVVAIIALLTAISIIAFGTTRRNAIDSTMQSDLRGAASALKQYYLQNGSYPTDPSVVDNGHGLGASGSDQYTYTPSNSYQNYCLVVSSSGTSDTYYVTDTAQAPSLGGCPVAPTSAPQIASIGYADATTTGSNTTNITVPSGVTTGSLIVVFIYGNWDGPSDSINNANNALGLSGGPFTAPAGFTFETGYETAVGDSWIGVYYKYATGTDTGTYSFVSKTVGGQTTGTRGGYEGGFAARVTGGPASGDPFRDMWRNSGTNGSSATIPSWTPGGNSSLLLGGLFDESGGTPTWPSGWTGSGGSSSNLLLAGYLQQTNATQTGTLAFSRTANDVQWAGVATIRPN